MLVQSLVQLGWLKQACLQFFTLCLVFLQSLALEEEKIAWEEGSSAQVKAGLLVFLTQQQLN